MFVSLIHTIDSVQKFPYAYIPLFLCWGSFLNVVAFRLLHNRPFFAARSQCPHCRHAIAWYDLVPVVSYVVLRGRCRTCAAPISVLYPFTEAITALFFVSLVRIVPPAYWLSYSVLFSALIITIRTDLESMLILRLCSLGLIPVGLILSYLNWLPVTVSQSAIGLVFGYGLLWAVRTLFWYLKKQEGLGEGDLELLAGIGAFTGFFGVWNSLLYGSVLGSVVGILASLVLKKKIEKLPFGPFLALGAVAHVLLLFR